ncbi:autotransporter domain-containing protein [Steroidobacter flavus]|uniref:Autotransporter domain-containing protein n=1 Tax=Steroidobacter flavus TaxID=1842136 RepID=A0ABV8SUG1_9GAMM
MNALKGPLAVAIAIALMPQAKAEEYSVSTLAQLQAAIDDANGKPDATATIRLTADINLSGTLPTPTKPITIDTQNFTLSGQINPAHTSDQTLTLAGTITGGANQRGLSLTSGTIRSSVINNGSISGGPGNSSSTSAGAFLNMATFVNQGTVRGGDNAGTDSGGNGVIAQRGVNVTNEGVIEGGDSVGGSGGTGVFLGGPAGAISTLTNHGIIRGGDGVNTAFGLGLDIRANSGLVINAGTIEGGINGVAILVNMTDATVTNSGIIRAGAGEANAIQMGGAARSLILELQAGSVIEGNVVANATLADTLRLGGTANSTFDVSGIGAAAQYQNFDVFEKTGTSTWTLLGVGAAATPWQILDGTLQLGDGGTSGSIIGDVLNNGTLAFNRSDALTHNGVISGTGSIRQSGTGTTILTASGSQASALDIQHGTLEIASGASLEAATTTIAAGATLRNASTFTATTGDNTFTLAGTFIGNANLLDGNDQVEIADGAVFSEAVFDGGAGTDTLDLTYNTFLTLAPTVAVNFEHLIKRGNGELTLAGNFDGFSDSIILAGGTAHLSNATIDTAELRIDSGVTVTGAGSLTGRLRNAGVLSPGNSPGTIFVGGDYLQDASGTLVSEITRTGTDLLHVAGGATLAGTHQIHIDYGLYLDGTTHTLIQADGGITGDFDSVQMNTSALMQGERVLNTNALDVTFERAAFTSVTTPNSGQGRYAQWLEEQIAASGLDAELTAYIDTLLQQSSADGVRRLLRQQSEPVASVTQNSVAILGAGFVRTVFDRFTVGDTAQCTAARGSSDALNCFWAHGQRQWGDSDGDAFGASYDWTTEGGQIGVDRTLSSAWAVGATFGYADSGIHDLNGGHNNVRSKLGGLYASYSAGRLGFATVGFYSDNQNETARNVQIGLGTQQPRAEFDTDSYGVGARLGYRLMSESSLLVRPFVEVIYDHLEGATIAERDGGAGNLSARLHDRDGLRGALGLQLAENFEGFGQTFRPVLELGVTRQFEDVRSTLDLQPGNSADGFRTYGAALDRTAVVGNISLAVALGANATVSLGYGRERADNYSQHEGNLNFRIAW